MLDATPCSVCPRKCRPIPAHGPRDATVLLIGERPGQEENEKGIPFIGKSGQELNKVYLPSAGLNRRDVMVTNAVQCAHETNETPTDEMISACADHHLPTLLDEVKPELIILVGGSAHKLIKDWFLEPPMKLDTVHGFPRYLSYSGVPEGSWVCSTFHPARALRDTKYIGINIADWKRIGQHLNGTFTSPTPPFSYIHTSLITSTSQVDRMFSLEPVLFRGIQVVGVDTESHRGPFSLQFSPSPGVGGMILADRKDLLSYLSAKYLKYRTVVYHHAIHDLVETVEMGVHTPYYVDTMQMAYHLCDQPQALKSLAWRLMGSNMRSWEDVVRPASVNALLEWMGNAYEIAEKDLGRDETVFYRRPYRGKLSKVVHHESKSLSVFSRIAKHTQTNEEYDPWDRVSDYETTYPEDYAYIARRLGDCPTLGIRNARLEDAVVYGCSDAIHTAVLPQVLYDLRFEDGLDRFRIAPGDEDRLR